MRLNCHACASRHPGVNFMDSCFRGNDVVFTFIVLSALLISLTGCAGIEPPSPKQIIEHPFGTSMLRAGLTKDQVLAQWGEPDLKEYDNTGKWGNAKERWTYYARMSGLPVDQGYLSKTQYLYFDGKYLVKYNE